MNLNRSLFINFICEEYVNYCKSKNEEKRLYVRFIKNNIISLKYFIMKSNRKSTLLYFILFS